MDPKQIFRQAFADRAAQHGLSEEQAANIYKTARDIALQGQDKQALEEGTVPTMGKSILGRTLGGIGGSLAGGAAGYGLGALTKGRGASLLASLMRKAGPQGAKMVDQASRGVAAAGVPSSSVKQLIDKIMGLSTGAQVGSTAGRLTGEAAGISSGLGKAKEEASPMGKLKGLASKITG